MRSGLTQDGEGDPEQEHGHAAQHRHKEVAGREDGEDGDRGVVSAEAANGSSVLGDPDEAQEQQGDHRRPHQQLEGPEIPEGQWKRHVERASRDERKQREETPLSLNRGIKLNHRDLNRNQHWGMRKNRVYRHRWKQSGTGSEGKHERRGLQYITGHETQKVQILTPTRGSFGDTG